MKQCPNCDREFEKQGGLNLHVKFHCKGKEGAAVEKPVRKYLDKCEHEYRLLSNKSQTETAAINAGFGEVCKTCQELR